MRLATTLLPEGNGSLKQPLQEDHNENLKNGSDLMSIMKAPKHLSREDSFTSFKTRNF